MSLWMDYSKDEIGLSSALRGRLQPGFENKPRLDGRYEIVHHEMTDSLEMDFVVKNKITGSYLCVIEVSARPGS